MTWRELVTLGFLLFCLAIPVTAENLAEKEDLGLELFRLMNPASVETEAIAREMLREAHPDEPEELWNELLASLDLTPLEAAVAPIYAERMTEDELRLAIEFYKTPAGKRLAFTQLEIAQATLSGMTELQETVFVRLEELLESGKIQGSPMADLHRQATTLADLRNIGTAMMSWLADEIRAGTTSFFPNRPEDGGWAVQPPNRPEAVDEYRRIGHQQLAEILVPHYLQELPAVDGWGNPLEFAVNEDPLSSAVLGIRSAGARGVFDTDDYRVGPFPVDAFESDVVWVDGYFARWPNVEKD